jgi:hypothetical protein
MKTTQTTTMTTPEALQQMGYRIWESGDKCRIYINDLARWYGIETTHYNTGNISSATLNGSGISNSRARKLGQRFSYAKLWFDLTTNMWNTQGFVGDDAAIVRDAVKAAVRQVKASAAV